MQEFNLVDQACALLERASGVKLHRDPAARKVKFLALGRWRGVLTQEDITQQYIVLSDHLDFVGVELRCTFTQTRKVNGDQLQSLEIRKVHANNYQTKLSKYICIIQGLVQVQLHQSQVV